MTQIELEKEIFYFYPEEFGCNSDWIEEVYLAGEFNEWGKNIQQLGRYKLIKDKTNKWIGIFDVPKGKGFYKFLINKNTYVPDMELLSYSTVTTPDWVKKTIWYQIMTDRFYNGDKSIIPPNMIPWDAPPDFFNNYGGDLKGIKEKIPYFKNLFGSLENKAIYLNPVHRSIASNHKYWPEDFETIDPQYGTEEDLKELIDALHNEKAKIILDLVYNHTGLNHYAFVDVLRKGKESEYFHWYRKLAHIPGEKIEIPVLEKYLDDKPQNITIENDPRSENFDPTKESYINVWSGKYKFPIVEPEKFKDATTEEILNNQPYYKLVPIYNDPNYKCWAGLFELPELNTKDSDLKKHLFNAARKWFNLGIDGFRLDVPDVIADPYQFWKEFRHELMAEAKQTGKNPEDIYIVGEIWSGGILGSTYLYGDTKGNPIRFDALMNYPIRENVLNFYSGEILCRASDAIQCRGEISVSELDKSLHKNIEYASWGTNQVQFNVFSSHDTRRLRTVLKDDRKLKAALIMQFTLPGSPTIYYGDEFGMNGGDDPENRAPMKWNIFENLLHHPEEASIFNFYKKLINLRNNNSYLIDAPVLTLVTDNENKIYAYARYIDNNNCAIILITRNGLSNDINIDISGLPFEDKTSWKDPISNKDYINYGRGITIQPADLKASYGIILTAV
ncbi:MAG: glycosidase [uncultured bacterium]|nr:MAG: glycosidase [uncultured bacterium]